MQKVFITGIDGFVGEYLVQDLVEKGYSITGTAFSFSERERFRNISSFCTTRIIDLLDGDGN